MRQHDPFLYSYMRSFNVPAGYYSQYITELTPTSRKRRPPKLKPKSPALPHPSTLTWVTPNHIAIARGYLKHETTTDTCQRNVSAALQRWEDASTKLRQAGARRALLHTQAELLAALVRAWEDTNGGVVTADNYKKCIARAIPAHISAAKDARKAAQHKIYAARHRRKVQERKQAFLRVQWEELREQYGVVRRTYLTARAGLRVAASKIEQARAARRVSTGDTNAQAPHAAVQEFKYHQYRYQTAKKDRDRVQREWRACKVKLYRLNKVGSS